MHEDAEEEEDEEPEPAGRGGAKKKRILFIFLPILLVLGVVAGAYFSGLADPLLHRMGSEKKPAEEISKKGQMAVFYDLPEILLNLDSEGHKERFIKIQISLELNSSLDIAPIKSIMPRIIDSFLVYLRGLRVEDLSGSSGLVRLREELLTRVNDKVKPVRVNDVLIRDILVQ
jgi:flagellar FliL protein